MEQFEKVCKGLECCVLCDPDDRWRCGECPYNPRGISNEPCANGLKFNALSLIRQQQERIKELEAAQTAKWEDPVSEGVWSWDKRAYTQCSSCKKKSYLGWKDPYCRYCGAKMLPEPPKEGTQG